MYQQGRKYTPHPATQSLSHPDNFTSRPSEKGFAVPQAESHAAGRHNAFTLITPAFVPTECRASLTYPQPRPPSRAAMSAPITLPFRGPPAQQRATNGTQSPDEAEVLRQENLQIRGHLAKSQGKVSDLLKRESCFKRKLSELQDDVNSIAEDYHTAVEQCKQAEEENDESE